MDGDELWDAFDGEPHRVRLGLRRLDIRAWTDLPALPHLATELDRKSDLLAAHHHDAVALLPGYEAMAAELLDRLFSHLATDHPDRYALEPDRIVLRDDGRSWTRADHPPLDLAGRIVAEDWCLVAGGVLVGATLCSPNRWRLHEKLGQPMLAVHAPVPGYAPAIGAPVDRLLATRSQPVWRQNWSIQPSPARFQPWAEGPTQPRIPDDLWVRSERETLVPLSDGWVFGIRTRIRLLADAPAAVRPRIRIAVETADPETTAYKELSAWRDGCSPG